MILLSPPNPVPSQKKSHPLTSSLTMHLNNAEFLLFSWPSVAVLSTVSSLSICKDVQEKTGCSHTQLRLFNLSAIILLQAKSQTQFNGRPACLVHNVHCLNANNYFVPTVTFNVRTHWSIINQGHNVGTSITHFHTYKIHYVSKHLAYCYSFSIRTYFILSLPEQCLLPIH